MSCTELDIAALRLCRRRPGMGNQLARQRLDLFAPVLAGTTVHAANGLLDADGQPFIPERSYFSATQRTVIERLTALGLI